MRLVQPNSQLELLVDEALRGLPERLIEDVLASGLDGIGLAVMYLVRGHEADASVVVVLVIPIEEPAAEAPGGRCQVGGPVRAMAACWA